MMGGGGQLMLRRQLVLGGTIEELLPMFRQMFM